MTIAEKSRILKEIAGQPIREYFRPDLEPQHCLFLKRTFEARDITYQVSCGRGRHAATIGGPVEIYAEGCSDDDAFCNAAIKWWKEQQQ